MFSKLKLGVSFASTGAQMAFFWGVELLFVLLLLRNLFAPQNNFLMAVILAIFWTVLSVVMTLRLYGKTRSLGQQKEKSEVA